MDFDLVTERLADERCGLFFLAGLDADHSGKTGVMSIHAAEGTLTDENRSYIDSVARSGNPGLRVEFRYHAAKDLYTPNSLENFAALFGHERIVADPTGAFARVSKLLELARSIRRELGSRISSILWQSHSSRLFVVATQQEDAQGAELDGEISALIDKVGCADLRRVIRSVAVGASLPQGHYTPVDGYRPEKRETVARMTRLIARISGIAAMVGLGTMAAAHAKAPASDTEYRTMMPGISALVGLTTLGENAYGQRNHFQAAGGLRLYFGDGGSQMASAFLPGVVGNGGFEMLDDPTAGIPLEDGSEKSGSKWPMPSRVAYAT